MSRVRRAVAGAARWLPAIGLGFGAFAALVRLTVRDRVPGLSTLFYATPPAVLGALMLACGVGWFMRRRWRPGGISLGLAVLCGLWQVAASRFGNPPPHGPSGPTLRVLFWNLAHGSRGWERIAAELARHDPDVACFVETGPRTADQVAVLDRLFPGQDRQWLDREMLVITKGRLERVSILPLDHGSRIAIVRLTCRERERELVLVDIESDLLRSRREALENLVRHCRYARPEIVLGDFNTPRDSALLGELRKDYVHAFEAAGNGFDGTWPMPLPILSIDHVWCARSLGVVSCRLVGSGASDHRAVVAEFGPPPAGTGPTREGTPSGH